MSQPESIKILKQVPGNLLGRIMSDSMRPVLNIGDEISINPISSVADLRRFDIIVFKRGDKLFCHFVWNIFLTRGQYRVVTRSIKEYLKSEIPLGKEQVVGLVTQQKITSYIKLKIILLNIVRRTA
jgi:signal peptidase I